MRLLQRPLRAFTLYSLLILIISIPVYFFAVDAIWLAELDEHNRAIKERITTEFEGKQLSDEELTATIQALNALQSTAILSPCTRSDVRADSLYEVTRMLDQEEERFRGIQSYLTINNQPYRITIETNLEEVDETLLAIAFITFLFFVVLILGFIYLNKRIAAKSWSPFYSTLKNLKEFDLIQDEKLPIEHTDILEFQQLNESLQKLVTENVSIYRQQKSFTENAAHELQTPLALIKSKLDLLIQAKHITPELSEIINGVEVPLARLIRINKNLLLLAKIENRQFEQVEKIELNTYLQNSILLFEDYLIEKELGLEQSVDPIISITANPYMVETLISNLFSNAIRHSPRAGRIAITTEENRLVFENSGEAPLHAESLFKRFSNPSSEVVGSGLGLAIVMEICSRYQWLMEYKFQDELHVFTITF